jgi:hypothetical protein
MVIWHRRQIEEILPSKRKACKKGRCSALATGASIHALQRPRAFSVINLDANRGILVFCGANAAGKDTYPIQKCRSATGKLGFEQRGPRRTRNLPFNLSTVHTHSGTAWGPLLRTPTAADRPRQDRGTSSSRRNQQIDRRRGRNFRQLSVRACAFGHFCQHSVYRVLRPRRTYVKSLGRAHRCCR